MDGRCDVCGKSGKIYVAASTMGPVSFAYCEKCLANGAEPYQAMVSYVACAGHFPHDINKKYQDIIRGNLKYLGKTEPEFISDVDKCIKSMENIFQNYLEEPE